MNLLPLARASLFALSIIATTTSAFARMEPKEGGEATPPRLTPQQILSGIYQPWSGPLAEVQKKLKPDRNYVMWIHVPAQHPMDMRSSDMFRRWALATPITQLTISHNMVAFRCRNQNGQMVTGATGMTGASKLQEVKALLAGYGLSVFFATYTDGHLNPQKEVGEYIDKNLKKRGAIFGGFEVSQEQCDSMQNFLVDFVNHPRRPFERFNNLGDPEKFEGGGCVTFATVLLKKAGILQSVIPSMFREMEAARLMLGGNLKRVPDVEPYPTPWLKGKRHSVSLNMFWTTPWEMDAEGLPGYVSLRQIDPEKMVYTLKQFAGVYQEGASAKERDRVTRRLAAGPLGQRVVQSANNLVDPGGPMEWSRFPINDSFDAGMASVGRTARTWFRSKVHEGHRIRLEEALGQPVLLLERE